MSQSNVRGIWLMIAASAALAVQDGFSRKVAGDYNTIQVVAFRYGIFALFVLARAARRPEGFRAAIRTRRLGLHGLRALALIADILLMVQAFTVIGLVQSHAVFAVCPLLVMAMSGPILGERISLARWGAVAVGLAGVLVILRPGSDVLTLGALMPLGAAFMWGLYSVLTRATTRDEPAFAAFFWPPVLGALILLPMGAWRWTPVAPGDWPWLFGYAGVAIFGSWLVTKAYEAAEASVLQPFAYSLSVFSVLVGLTVFGERLEPLVALGGAIVLGAGLYALILARGEARAARAAVRGPA